MANPAVVVDIQAKFGKFKLDAKFQAPPGITVLTGASGAGKTSVANALAGLMRPKRGRIVVEGNVLFDRENRIDLSPGARRCGYVLQDPLLFPHMSVKGNLGFGARKGPVSRTQVIKLLGLGSLLRRRPRHLSGGERQRVAIGRALLSNPEFLLMDEPLTGLDAARRLEVLPFIELLRDELAIPIVYITHHWPEIVRLADTVVVMENGQVTASGPTGDVIARLQGTALGMETTGSVITAKIEGHDSRYGLTVLNAPAGNLYVGQMGGAPGETVRLFIDSKNVALSLGYPEDISIQNILFCQVHSIKRLVDGQHDVDLTMEGGGQLVARITKRALDQMQLTRGTKVHALVKSVAVDKDLIAHPLS